LHGDKCALLLRSEASRLPEQIVVPNVPSNSSRALLLLQRQGLIKVMDPTDIFATAHDIVWNPKKLKIREREALRSPEATQFVQDTYHGAVLATF
jgi:ABC-type metal ion transport system substrate-binding protein